MVTAFVYRDVKTDTRTTTFFTDRGLRSVVLIFQIRVLVVLVIKVHYMKFNDVFERRHDHFIGLIFSAYDLSTMGLGQWFTT
jgi:hypothetical protein